jgi:hypothetical protein
VALRIPGWLALFLPTPIRLVVDVGDRVDAIDHLNLAEGDPGSHGLPQHFVADGLKRVPVTGFPQAALGQTKRAVVRGTFVNRQADKFLDGELKVDHLLGLAFGQIVEVRDEQHLEDNDGRLGRSPFCGQARTSREQNRDKKLPINRLVQFDEEMIAQNNTQINHVAKERAVSKILESLRSHQAPPRDTMTPF